MAISSSFNWSIYSSDLIRQLQEIQKQARKDMAKMSPGSVINVPTISTISSGTTLGTTTVSSGDIVYWQVSSDMVYGVDRENSEVNKVFSDLKDYVLDKPMSSRLKRFFRAQKKLQAQKT